MPAPIAQQGHMPIRIASWENHVPGTHGSQSTPRLPLKTAMDAMSFEVIKAHPHNKQMDRTIEDVDSCEYWR